MRHSVFDFAVEVDRQISTLTREEFYLRTGRAKRQTLSPRDVSLIELF